MVPSLEDELLKKNPELNVVSRAVQNIDKDKDKYTYSHTYPPTLPERRACENRASNQQSTNQQT